jgi:hypothetical protein
MKEGRADTYEGLMKAFEEAKRKERKGEKEGRPYSMGKSLKILENGQSWSINTNE